MIMQRKIWILSAFVFLISSVFAYALYMHGYNKENRNLDHGKKFLSILVRKKALRRPFRTGLSMRKSSLLYKESRTKSIHQL
ncbi:MAG TPA: hypothetical protein PLG49_02455 [Defluviitaleaceae bacterium]|nr:hypothetical protein [Defluviitaleaceae bacterium]